MAGFILPGMRLLLERYRQGMVSISEASEAETAITDLRPWSGGLPDLEGQAMESLSKHLARCLVKMSTEMLEGQSTLDLATLHIPQRLKDVEAFTHSRLYAFRFDEVPYYWRQLYSDCQIMTTFHTLIKAAQVAPPVEPRKALLGALDDVVARLDRCVVTAGGGGRILGKIWIETTIRLIQGAIPDVQQTVPSLFSSTEMHGRPAVTKPVARHHGWTISMFEEYMEENHRLAVRTGKLGPKPVVFTDLMGSWPAMEHRGWCRADYLMSQTLGGRRLVPIEVGRSYVDEGWGQELIPFKEFLVRYIDNGLASGDATDVAVGVAENGEAPPMPKGYLAQHNLFNQIPQLRNDIRVPDYCWADIPSGHPFNNKSSPRLEVPEINAWFGPAGTITPLHTDGYTNILCQVVGTKYVRLYPPQADRAMRPRSDNENGIDMSNTSSIDLDLVEGWDLTLNESLDGQADAQEYLNKLREDLRSVEYFDCILEPGEALLIPVGWWHYVRSLSISFSVSFWF